MAKKKITKSNVTRKDTSSCNNKGKIIKTHGFELVNYDNQTGKISFESVFHHKKCSIESWTGKEMKLLVDKFKMIESLTWLEIQRHSGLDFKEESYTAIAKPETVPQDTTLSSIRIDKKMRIFGYRVNDFFYIVFFDKNHIVCPMNKSKRYSS